MNYARVELKGSEWFSHYILVIYCVMTSVAGAWHAWSQPPGDRLAFLWIAFFSLAMAGMAFWWQWMALRYRRIRTARTAEDNYLSVSYLANDNDWQFTRRDGCTCIQGCVAPEFGGYARRVTVLFDGQDVYVNSIMNPGRFFSPGLLSWGGIDRDISGVAEAVGAGEQRS